MPRKPRPAAPPLPPPMPPPTERENELNRIISLQLQELNARLLQRNLDNAVLLAQQAARGQGPLIDHFCELGRRFGDALNTSQPEPKPKLRAIPGGRK